MHLALVGPMGAGKSTTGQLAANALGLPFKDSDALVSLHEGSTIAELFALHGEAYFRNVEERIILDVLRGSCTVLATGGGAIMSAAVRHALHQHTCCVYLQVEVDEQLRRLGNEGGRPLAGDAAHMQHLQCSRELHYRAVAHAVVATNGRSVQEVAEEVVACYRACCPALEA
jgi:shikimate kinase